MTLEEVLDMALKRAGLLESTTTYKDQGRLYANLVAKEIMAEADWWFAYRTATFRTTRRLTVTSVQGGPYVAGETITAGSYTASIDSHDTTNNYLYVYSESSTTPSGTITGTASGAESTFSSREFTRTYLLAEDVMYPHWFVNETDGRPLAVISQEEYVENDADRSDTGDAGAVVIEGLDSDQTTGQIAVSLLPRHSTTNETFRYGYYLFLSDWTSSDDTVDLKRWIHPMVHPALVFGVAKLYKQEKGADLEDIAVELNEYSNVIKSAKRQNLKIQGNRRFRKEGNMHRRNSVGRGAFDFYVQPGSLSAAS